MPWPEVLLVNIRRDFVFRALQPGANMSALCREYGISRKTGYKWLKRYRAKGVAGLQDESRRPSNSPLQVSAETALRAVQLRRKHPRWGPKKIQVLLANELGDEEPTPSVRTVARILERAGEVRRRRSRSVPPSRPAEAPVVRAESPNDVWTVDFKGWWRALDGERCEPLTVRDAATRYLLCVRLVPSTSYATVREVFEELFERYGLPRAILSDNGTPFACTRALHGLTRLSAWWRAIGVEHLRSRPGHPQDNGGHERMHGDMKVALQANALNTVVEQQAACDAWADEFNYLRPHESLDMQTPASRYRPSSRSMPRLILGGYPEQYEVRMVNSNGILRYMGRDVRVSKSLRGYPVGLQRAGDMLHVWFYDLLLGLLEPVEGTKVQPLGDTLCSIVTPKPSSDVSVKKAAGR